MTRITLLILLILSFKPVFSQSIEQTKFENINIGLTHAPPMIILEKDKPPKGMLVDFLKSVAELENWNIIWTEGTWSEVMAKAETGEVELMTYIAYTPERAEIFNFSSERFVTGWGQVYSYSNESINSILDLDYKKVAVVKDDIHAKRFENLCHEYSVNCIFTIANDYDSAFEMLYDNKVSAAVGGSTIGITYEKKYKVIRTPIMFNPSDALFAVAKTKSKSPLVIIDKYLAEWRNKIDSPYAKSQKKWMSTLHDNSLPKWIWYLIISALSLLFISIAIALFLREQIKKHVQQHINHSNQLKQIINLVPHMIYVVNSKGEIELANKYAAEYFGINIISNLTKNQLLQNIPQFSNLFLEDYKLITEGKGLIHKELNTINHNHEEVILKLFKAPFTTTNEFPSVLTVGVDVTEQKKYQKQIQYIALHDELTKLPNRQFLRATVEKALKNAIYEQSFSSILYIDLDFFKDINDSLGHAAGDKLLIEVCKRLLSIANKNDMVSRIGGDEFILHLNSKSQDINEFEKLTHKKAREVIASLSEKIVIEEQEQFISASIGIVIYPRDAKSYEQIMQRADIAMYQAKNKGRNNYVVFEEHMEKSILFRHNLVGEIRHAINNDEFFIEYQPQIYGNNISVVGLEALIRWNHPNGSVVYPDDFIPTAEDSGLIVPIGNWVLEQVCKQINLWMENYNKLPFITVNLSVLQIHNKNLVDYLSSLLSKYNIPANLIELEVTETVLIKQIEKTVFTLSELKKIGVRLSIDDFGTGYSSLSYLKKLPFDKLKIDYTFVKDILTDKENRTLVKTIIGMTQDLGLEVIAEGVETIEQLNMLTEMGCHHFQGYLLDAPLPVKIIEEKYLKKSTLQTLS